MPSRSNVPAVSIDSADNDILIPLNTDEASRIEAHARELDRLLKDMRGTDGNED
jgi:hypothetical protein